jgi:hypothetical protein
VFSFIPRAFQCMIVFSCFLFLFGFGEVIFYFYHWVVFSFWLIF